MIAILKSCRSSTLLAIFLFRIISSVEAHEGEAGHAHDSKNQVTIALEGEFRIITANGLPDHTTGQFPNRGNPNRITVQSYRFRVPAKPKANDKPTPCTRQPFGIALNGILFDPGTAEYWQNDRNSNWNYEALSGKIHLGLDSHQAHVQPNGAYHYHGIPKGLVERLRAKSNGMLLLGYAADGFPIYYGEFHKDANDPQSELVKLKPSFRLKSGTRPDGPDGAYDGTFTADYEYVPLLGDLDECNGRDGITPEYPEGTYYYAITATFPHVPRMFRGTPDASFQRRPPPSGAGRPAGRPPGPTPR
jgi:YHYH protein